MKPKISKTNSRFKRVVIQVTIIICTVVFLESCRCERGYWAMNVKTGYRTFNSSGYGGPEDVVSKGEFCSFLGITKGFLAYGETGNSSPDSTITGNNVTQVSGTNSSNPKKSPIIIEGEKPAEYFATTITAGPSLNFKSSNEEYGGGYGNHQPGIGFNIGVGTVLPFNKHWAIASSLRFTQKNASEELGYTEPGGGGMQFTDKYSYNYLGGTMLAQYRASKNIGFVAGPEVNFLLASSVKNGGSNGTGEKRSLNKTSQKIGLDILAGIKYEIPAKNSRSRWGLQLMYDHRLSRLNKKKDENGQNVPAYKMKSVQLGLAYNICNCDKKK